MYRVTFVNGSSTQYRSNTPKDAAINASKQFSLEVVFVKFVR